MTAPRLAAWATVVAAAVIAGWTVTFTTSFPADPLGPRVFPVVAALLMGGGGLRLLLRPGSDHAPESPLSAPAAWAALSFVGYALLLEPLGFAVATLLEFVVLARLFGGRLVPSVLVGGVLAGLLYLLFVVALGLPLPIGSLWIIAP